MLVICLPAAVISQAFHKWHRDKKNSCRYLSTWVSTQRSLKSHMNHTYNNNLNQDSQCQGRNSNQVPPRYESEMLLPEPTSSLCTTKSFIIYILYLTTLWIDSWDKQYTLWKWEVHAVTIWTLGCGSGRQDNINMALKGRCEVEDWTELH